MRIGLIARADTSGLSAKTHAFWRHMRPAKTLIVNMDEVPGVSTLPTELDRIQDANAKPWTPLGYPKVEPVPDPVVDEFLTGLDVVYTAETPYNYYLFERARELGVATVMHVNPEYLDNWVYRDVPCPTVYWLPTFWFDGEIARLVHPEPVRVVPVPVDMDASCDIQDIPIDQPIQLVHYAGVVPSGDRNGTQLLMEAMHLVKRDDVRLTIASQRGLGDEIPPHTSICVESYRWPKDLPIGHVMVIPRRYGGLCLPMQEAMARSMMVLMSDVTPQSAILPPGQCIPTSLGETLWTGRLAILTKVAAPSDIATAIDSLTREQIGLGMRWARSWAQANDWETLQPLIVDRLAEAVRLV